MFSDQESRATVFARDVLRDRQLYNYNRTYPVWALASLLVPAVLGFAIGGTLAAAFSGFIFGGLARVFVANQAAWCVGSISHMIGSRPFVTRDNSANNWPVAIFTFGEGLQNNHHAFPGAYRHAMRWWEPDVSGWVLAVLAKAGIVWDLQHAGSPHDQQWVATKPQVFDGNLWPQADRKVEPCSDGRKRPPSTAR